MEKCIILDMDNTLISGYLKRPYLKEFMAFVFANFKHVAIWTAAEKSWLQLIYNRILEPLIPEGKKFTFMWSRADCTITSVYCPAKKINEMHTFKELRYVFAAYNDFTAKNTFIVDDNLFTCSRNPNNALHIKPFTDGEVNGQFMVMPSLVEQEDTELLWLMRFIETYILQAEDVRSVGKLFWYTCFN